jgi:tetratricopeptide (TPR) repeat protein
MAVRTRTIVSCLALLLTLNGVAFAKSWRVSGAIVHMRQKEYDAAIKLLEEEVGEAPDNAEAWAYLGDAFANQQDFMKAAGAWDRAEEIYSGKNKKKELKKIEQSREFFWAAAINVGHEYLAKALKFSDPTYVPEEGETVPGDLAKAEEGFVATYRVFGAHPKTLFLLGLVYDEKANYYAGLDAEKVVEVTDYDLDSGSSVVREVKAGEYAIEMWEKALTTYEMAVGAKRADLAGHNWDEKSGLDEYLIKLVNACLRMKQYERALAIIEPLLEEKPGDMMLLNAKAAVLDKLGRIDEAIATYDKVVESTDDPKIKGEVLGEIAAYYLRKEYEGRDPKKAVEYLERAVEYSPDDYRAYINLGKAYGEIGEYEKGKEYLEKGQALYEQQQKK